MEKSTLLHENAQYWFEKGLARVRLALSKAVLVWLTDFRCAHYMSDGETVQSL